MARYDLRFMGKSLDYIIPIGGGTGSKSAILAIDKLPRLVGGKYLKGEKGDYPRFNIKRKIAAVASCGDDGGSTGILRLRYDNVPIVGDLRRLFQALTNPNSPMGSLFRHRFSGGEKFKDRPSPVIRDMPVGAMIGKAYGHCTQLDTVIEKFEDDEELNKILGVRFDIDDTLSQHSLMNFVILGAFQVSDSPEEGISLLGRLLDIEGKAFPVTETPYTLTATYVDEDGNPRYVTKQTEIDTYPITKSIHNQLVDFGIDYSTVDNEPNVIKPLEDIILYKTNAAIVGPGSWLTSPIAGTKPIAELLIKRKTPIIVVCNNFTNPETHKKTNQDHVNMLLDYTQWEGQYLNVRRIIYNNQNITKDELAPFMHHIRDKGWDPKSVRVLTDKPTFPGAISIGANLLYRNNPFNTSIIRLSEALYKSGLRIRRV